MKNIRPKSINRTLQAESIDELFDKIEWKKSLSTAQHRTHSIQKNRFALALWPCSAFCSAYSMLYLVDLNHLKKKRKKKKKNNKTQR